MTLVFLQLLLCFQGDVPDLGFYFGAGTRFNSQIPTPQEHLGFQVGEWHVSHDQLTGYMKRISEVSPRAIHKITGHTHERRELMLLFFSSPENLAKLEQLRQDQLRLVMEGKSPGDLEDMPIFIWLGYSVHGNEASGGNASLLSAYYLAASDDAASLLEKAVVIVDPCLNPDGFNRFASWVNMHRGQELVSDPGHREHLEGWPNGRTNHYWFDLNRDWLLLQHPESRARVAQYQRWRPAILCDFHEMGTNQTYFFQPGIPSRQNPLTPDANLQMTRMIGQYHAKAMDAIGELYYTEQSYDDFYYGKGSTYPDAQGTIGILFEQASARGHRQRNSFRELTFYQAVKNQLTTSLSTLRAGSENRTKLLAYQRDFTVESLALAAKDPVKAYVFGDNGDPVRAFQMAHALHQHRIKVHHLAQPVKIDGKTVEAGYVVPVNQVQYRLVKTVFEERTSFPDETFYDVSAWNFPHAYGLPFTPLAGKAFNPALAGDEFNPDAFPQGDFEENGGSGAPYAYVIDWRGYQAPKLAYRLLTKGVKLRAAASAFAAPVNGAMREFKHGTLLLPMGIQDVPADEIGDILRTSSQKEGVNVYAIHTGITPKGIDLGSPSFINVPKPKILMITGPGVSTYDAGQIWHLLDNRYRIPVTMSDISRLNRVRLGDYTHLIMVGGGYGSISASNSDQIKAWVRSGGTLVAIKSAIRWVIRQEMVSAQLKGNGANGEKGKGSAVVPKPFEERSRLRALESIAGAIFKAELDPTHPVAWGYDGTPIAMFRNHTMFFKPVKDPFTAVVRYTANPLLAGYISAKNLETLKKTPAVIANGYGRGATILLADDPAFRGFWLGTHRLFLNSLFFSGPITRVRGRD